MSYARYVYHFYAVRLAGRNKTQLLLLAEGIQSSIHYPITVHLQEAFFDLGCQIGDFPASEQVAKEIISLPMFVKMESEQIDLCQTTYGIFY